ncbi:MAG: BMP family ABC transporter substrate-binding protein [Clostridia bacterium]|nr:BMP family ABC transporter substrate-binding protein [Clostridia bacterium]
MKKVLALVLAAIMMLCASAMADTSVSNTAAELTGDPAAIKVGAVMLGDENEGYTYAHIAGIQKAAEQLGIAPEQIMWKYHVTEDATCYDAAADLADAGCDVVFSNSYGHQTYMQQVAAEFPEVQFVAVTGDTANKSGLDNFSNAFNETFESRYVSGVVAGMKIAEMIAEGSLAPENLDANGNVKLGYVGAYPYAEVVSGYTAYYLGVKSVVENVVMDVTYTNSWFDITAEAEAANALLASGCVMICQHADSTGAPSAVQAAREAGKNVYCVGYNIDMLSVAPDAALTSATNNWDVYYAYAMAQVINGEKIARNWTAGYAENAVCITALGSGAAAGTAEKVAEVEAALKDGSLKVFDTSTFTVGGEVVTSTFATDTDGDFVYDADEAIIDGAYCESYYQSAPSFALRIDGITELLN